MRLHITPLFADFGGNFPTINDRIRECKATGLVPLIIIDGKSQTGKSTLAKKICGEYDPNFKLVFTVEDVVEYMEELGELYNAGKIEDALNRVMFWDEPQGDITKKFWDERNEIIQQITSMWGFLKPMLVMALPNVSGLSDIILTNMLMRISIKARLDKTDGTIIRKAYVRIPWEDMKRNKWRWTITPVEVYTVPKLEDITQDKGYMDRKVNNFFNTQMTKWKTKLAPRGQLASVTPADIPLQASTKGAAVPSMEDPRLEDPRIIHLIASA
jgi:hypothetical protein